MKNSKVSFLLSIYNDEKYIKECIESIVNQTYKNFELIIIDDGSTDNSVSIIRQFKDNRIKLYSKKNSGLADSLNYGLDKCTGLWIARMDGDDICYPNRLEEQIKYINDDIAVIGSFVDVIDEKGKKVLSLTNAPIVHEEIVDNILNAKPALVHPSVLINKKFLLKVGGYDTRFNIAEDIELWLRLSKVGRIINIEKKLLKLRKHNENISIKKLDYQLLIGLLARKSYYATSTFEKLDDNEFNYFKKKIEKMINQNNLVEKRKNRAKLSKLIKQEKNIFKLIIEFIKNPFIFNGLLAQSTWEKINNKIKAGEL